MQQSFYIIIHNITKKAKLFKFHSVLLLILCAFSFLFCKGPFVLGAVPINDLISIITLLFFIAFISGLPTAVVQGDPFHLLGDRGRFRCVGRTFKQVNVLGAGLTSQGWAGHVVAPEGDLWFNVTEMGEKRRRRKEGSGQGRRGAAFIYILQTSHLPVRLITRRFRGAPGRESELFCFDKVSKKSERCLGLR